MSAYTVVYGSVLDRKALKRIPKNILSRIRRAIEGKLALDPRSFGKPLRRSLSGSWSLRVGDYRVIYRIAGKTVEIYAIEHRSVVYEQLGKGMWH